MFTDTGDRKHDWSSVIIYVCRGSGVMVLACVCSSVSPALRVPACGQHIRETAGQYLCCVVSNNSIIDVAVHLFLIDLLTTFCKKYNYR